MESSGSWVKKAVADSMPLVLGALPFGLLLGFTINDAADIVHRGVSWSSNIYVFGGASQIAMTDLLGAGGAVGVAIVVGLVINARHLMYSAALAHRFTNQPRWFKVVAPLWLIDQLFALVTTQTDEDMDPRDFRAYWLAVGLTFYTLWAVWVTVGVFVGPIIPESWPVEFALPAMFIALVVPTLQTRPALVAAVVGAVIGATASVLPLGLGLLTGGVIGIIAGTVMERRSHA